MLQRKVFGKRKVHRMENILHRRAISYMDSCNTKDIHLRVMPVFHNGTLCRMFVINKLYKQWKVTCFSKEKEIPISVRSK